ncbi:hypothetical protein [Pseudomonas antarctica]|uniref:hypothetical protein n=1 Tax=Pseudomonas antarctica TaxID=219572 RepID=UPI003F75000A
MINVRPSPLHAALTRAAETSNRTPQTANAQPNPEPLESTPASPSYVRPVLSRSRRDLQNTQLAAAPRDAAVRRFAEALVERGDSELAVGVGNSLIRQRLASETGRSSDAQEKVAVPPHSAFGQCWSELADALESEPFKSFAEARLIETSNLIIGANGDLSEKEHGALVSSFSHDDPEWSAASAAVLAAVSKLTGAPPKELRFYGREQAPASAIAHFYGLQLGHINSNDTLSTAAQLLSDGRFWALGSANPIDAPIKQRQREAIQRIVDLPSQALTSIVERFTPSTMQQKVQQADQALAQKVSQGLMKLVPETRQYETSVVLDNIPEYSTFNLVRKNFLSALNGSAFTTFAQENDLAPTSIAINPVSGELAGTVKGVNTTFTLNDVSGWADAWAEIKEAAQQMPTGDDGLVKYPRSTSAPLYEVMSFYNEAPSHQQNTGQQNRQQRQLIATLNRVVEINQNNGFKALIDTGSSDPEAAAVRQRQQATIVQLDNTPVSLSPLERLAAAVVANSDFTEQSVETREDVMARAETEMAIAVHRTMLELKADPTKAASTVMQSTPSSLFDLQKTYLKKAANSLGMEEFYRKNNFSPRGAAWLPPRDDADQRARAREIAKQFPEHADALMHRSAAATPFSANGESIRVDLADGNSVPFQWVFNFYGISTDPGSPAFAKQLELIGRTQQLPRTPENLPRAADALNRRIIAVGDSNDRYALLSTLENGEIDKDDRADSMRFVVDPDSSHHPKGVKEARAFLAENGWYIPTSKAESDNLIAALRTPIPKSPALGNHWGFLSTDIPLSNDQRSKVSAFVKRTAPDSSLLSYLGAHVAQLSEDPEKALDQLISTPQALKFGTDLQAEMKGAATATSLKQWLLTALVLELDPTAGTQHRTLAGIDLAGAAYSGHGTDFIREQLTQQLIAKKGIPVNLAPVATRFLMSGTAPHLLVKEVPKHVTLGSPEWFSFTAAVNRIEWTAPGATANMTYRQVMDHHTIQPISALEAQIKSYAQMNPLLDWAALNNDVDKDSYTLEQLKDSQVKLQAQTQATAEGVSWLSTVEAPTRRSMTLKVLREEFGANIDYESRFMVENELWGVITGRHYSLAEIYEAGRLDESWLQEGHHVDFARLRNRAKEPDFPVINDAFDKAIKQDFKLRRRHTVTLMKDMLANLPVEERKSVLYGDVEFLNVAGAGSGMVMTSVYKGVRRDFAIYPARGRIVRIADIDPSTPLGKNVSLEIDAEAFKNGAEPKAGVKSNVVLSITDQHLLDDNDEPWPQETSFLAHKENDPFSSHYARGRIDRLARTMVDSTYLNKTQFLNLHRNASSNTLETATEPSDFFKAVWHALPGASSLEDIYHGQLLKAGVDLAIDVAIYAATEGAGKLWGLAKSGASWAAAKVSAGFIEKFGAKEAENVALTDLTSASSAQSSSAITPPANRADGTITDAGAQQANISAVFQDGNWYAFDAKTQAAYGPALEGFVSQTSSALRQETFADGTQALVLDKPLAADAYTIPRANGFDLVNEGKVYRYDTSKPGLITDLESADHFKPRDDFEAFCPAPALSGRSKRGTNDECFVKVINDVEGEFTQELQALEHSRLYPSPAKSIFNRSRYTVFERRLYKVGETQTGTRLVPTLETTPITYKSRISGAIINAPEFGFYGGVSSSGFEAETRVVKLGSISTACNDQREIRGVILKDVNEANQLIIEADTNVFYRARLTEPARSTLLFEQCTFSPYDTDLVAKYRGKLTLRQRGNAGLPIDANLVSLPKLNAVYKRLEKSGFTKVQVATLKSRCAGMTAEQQREVAYQLLQRGAIEKTTVALKPGKVLPLKIPENFSQRPVAAQNQFYAEQAKDSVLQALSATGLGPSNLVRTPSDLARADAAQEVIRWLRENTHSGVPANYGDLIIKSGAGNCGEMSILSADLINKSGGRAYRWEAGDAHALTVVGGPSTRPRSTIDFSGPEWVDAWVVDPWTNIACPASEYTKQLKAVMNTWNESGLVIREGTNMKMSPLDAAWIDTLINKPKSSVRSAYK